MKSRVPLIELQARMNRFRAKMEAVSPDWEIVIVFSKINMYYFTGTMQDGMLIIPKSGEAVLWVRRSIERAIDESLFPKIMYMQSFGDASKTFNNFPDAVYLETEVVPMALFKRLSRYFPYREVKSADSQIMSIRAVKSSYEVSLMEQAGKIHQHVMEDLLPEFFAEGMSEAALAAQIYKLLIEEGHQGVVRLGMFETEIGLGHICFGESSIYPSYFNGASGNYGMGAAVPVIGSRDNLLKKGDLIYIDTGCGVDGYHTDKTMTYMFGKSLPETIIEEHYKCVDIQDRIAGMLKPGAIPAEIYNSVMDSLDSGFLKNFLGFGNRTVKFLGHGIGLQIDEVPVIAEGFYEPLEEGMTFAIEPKKGFKGVGMVGIENTFLVTPQGGRSISGDNRGLIRV